MVAYFKLVWYTFDIFCNVLLFGKFETLSSRMGRNVRENKCFICKGICRLLSIFWPDHCIHNVQDVTFTKE